MANGNPWWDGVPEHFRDCYHDNRHDLDETSASTMKGYELEWHLCVRCTTKRLTTIDPLGNMVHDYTYPAGYRENRPVLTDQDRKDYRRYRAKRNRKNLPGINADELHQLFPQAVGRL